MSRKTVDWEGLQSEYRAGIRSLADIGAEYGVSAPAIVKRAKRDGWERDLSAKIKAKAEAKVNAAAVNAQVNAVNEREIVEANANVAASAIIRQRDDIKRSRGVVTKLFDELEFLMDQHGDLKDVAAIMASEDAGAMEALLNKVTALPTKTDVAKKLSEALRILVELERKVLKLDDEQPGDRPKPTRIELVPLA